MSRACFLVLAATLVGCSTDTFASDDASAGDGGDASSDASDAGQTVCTSKCIGCLENGCQTQIAACSNPSCDFAAYSKCVCADAGTCAALIGQVDSGSVAGSALRYCSQQHSCGCFN